MTTTFGDGDFRYTVDAQWGELPEGLDFGDVADVAIGGNDSVYVLSRGSDPIVVLDSKGAFTTTLGQGVFNRVHGVYLAADDTIWVADDMDHAVYHLDAAGQVLQVLGTPGQPSDTGAEPGKYMSVKYAGGPFNLPTASAIAVDGNLYVTDGYGNGRVHCFSPSGELLRSFGEPGIGQGCLRLPHAIAVCPSGDRLVVCDRENSRLQYFDLDGTFISETSDIVRPNGVAFDRDGNMYVAELGLRTGNVPGLCCDGHQMPPVAPDSPPSRVSVWSPSGVLLSRWGDMAVPCEEGNFFCAHGIAVDSKGDVYVGQTSWMASVFMGQDPPVVCHRLQKFSRV